MIIDQNPHVILWQFFQGKKKVISYTWFQQFETTVFFSNVLKMFLKPKQLGKINYSFIHLKSETNKKKQTNSKYFLIPPFLELLVFMDQNPLFQVSVSRNS